jgi:hypothetical protein
VSSYVTPAGTSTGAYPYANQVTFFTTATTAATNTVWVNAGASTGVTYGNGGSYLDISQVEPYLSPHELEALVRKAGGRTLWPGKADPTKPRLRLLTPQEEKENRELVAKGLPAKHRPQLVKALWRLPLDADYPMPDGSFISIDAAGNYHVDDKNAKVVYKANRQREFNPYISASDLLEKFIDEVGVLDDVRQDEVLRLPIEAFINWLILQAARRDGDRLEGLPSVESALPTRLALPNPNAWGRPRCDTCGRFLKKAWAQAKIAFCSPEHMQLRLTQLGAPT